MAEAEGPGRASSGGAASGGSGGKAASSGARFRNPGRRGNVLVLLAQAGARAAAAAAVVPRLAPRPSERRPPQRSYYCASGTESAGIADPRCKPRKPHLALLVRSVCVPGMLSRTFSFQRRQPAPIVAVEGGRSMCARRCEKGALRCCQPAGLPTIVNEKAPWARWQGSRARQDGAAALLAAAHSIGGAMRRSKYIMCASNQLYTRHLQRVAWHVHNRPAEWKMRCRRYRSISAQRRRAGTPKATAHGAAVHPALALAITPMA